MQMEEITIALDWGNIAGKWWGPRNVRPIVLLHGWHDNAGSFDRLARVLPETNSYLAIDFPGYGHSSHLPEHAVYSIAQFAQILDNIRENFDWEKISLMGHLMGAIVAYVYAGTFPKRVDLLISLSILQPLTHLPNDESTDASLSFANNQLFNGEPPVYTIRELVNRILSASKGSVSPNRTLYLIRRGVRPSATLPERYHLLRDVRVQQIAGEFFPEELITKLARGLFSIPHLFLRTNYYQIEGTQLTSKVMEMFMVMNRRFEWHEIRGTHHVHLNQPEKVAGVIANFLQKYQPNISNKL